MTPEAQLAAAALAYGLLIIATISAVTKKLPGYIDTAVQKRFADDDVKRQETIDKNTIAIEKAKTENFVDSTMMAVTKDLAAGVLSTVTELRRMNDMQAASGGHLVTLNTDVKNINKALEPLPTMAEQIAKILKIVEEIKREPHLSTDKAQRIDDAIKQLGVITNTLKEVVIVLEDKQADLIQRAHDSKPIPITLPESKPNGKEQ